ncbi:MAG: TIR domain-containing protein, partial [Methylococcales bacterium]
MQKVFLSYSHHDFEFVKDLYERLRHDGIECFLDKESIAWGSNWVVELEKGIDACEVMLVVLSNAYCASEWTRIENTSLRIEDPAALSRKIRPLVYEDCSAVLPRFFKPIQSIDVSTSKKFEAAYPKIRSELQEVLKKPRIDPAEQAGPKPAGLKTADYYRRCIERWANARYALDKRFVNLTLLLDQGEDVQGPRWHAAPEKFADLESALEQTTDLALVILGAPGSGKSTLLRNFELEASRNARKHTTDPDSDSARYTFFIQLGEYKP